MSHYPQSSEGSSHWRPLRTDEDEALSGSRHAQDRASGEPFWTWYGLGYVVSEFYACCSALPAPFRNGDAAAATQICLTERIDLVVADDLGTTAKSKGKEKKIKGCGGGVECFETLRVPVAIYLRWNIPGEVIISSDASVSISSWFGRTKHTYIWGERQENRDHGRQRAGGPVSVSLAMARRKEWEQVSQRQVAVCYVRRPP